MSAILRALVSEQLFERSKRESKTDDAIEREREYILSLDQKEAVDYIAWRYRRTREVYNAHNMSDAEIDKVAIEQYERIREK
jgi:hypothetical protein